MEKFTDHDIDEKKGNVGVALDTGKAPHPINCLIPIKYS